MQPLTLCQFASLKMTNDVKQDLVLITNNREVLEAFDRLNNPKKYYEPILSNFNNKPKK